MEKIYKAHVNETTKKIQTVKEHSENTAQLSSEFAVPILKDVIYTMGMLHDAGKYQESFQRKIDGANLRVEHSLCGALIAKEKYPDAIGLMMEYCIAGHHSGIPDGGALNDTADMQTLCGRLKRKFENYSTYQEELTVPKIDSQKCLQFLAQDCGKDTSMFIDKFAFLTRYSFSCLVDADSLDTANFCGVVTARLLKADFSVCLKKVDHKLSSFVCETTLQKSRAVLQEQVFQKTKLDAEIFLMNMPTGSGKTLCSVKFALERAIQRGKKRIIYIIPYNSIIDQTAEVFGNLFQDEAEILRHQSTFSYEDEKNGDEDYASAAKSAAENWDAPFIITTAVQFFESIYANKRGKLRKLHNMADSILIFDEAHLMPENYLQPSLQAIAFITRYLNSEAVFLTATMPDFDKLVKQYALSDCRIIDLIDDHSLFSKFQKCRYRYLGKAEREEILTKASEYPSSLLIVNTRKTARKLFQECGGRKFHLSTYMTAYDRKRVIHEIKEALDGLEADFPNGVNIPEDRRITIISTSLIEAGVDLDVHTVFRELSGLDSILQAGGRCNREGKRTDAETFIFEFADEAKGVSKDERGNITRGLLRKYSDISCPESIKEYYDRLFFLKKEEIQKKAISKDCHSIASIPFRKYAEDFELIASQIVSIVVPRDEKAREMIESLRYTGTGIGVGRKLQKYTCSIYQTELDDLIRQHVAENFGIGIWCLTNSDYYDEKIGILFEANDYYL